MKFINSTLVLLLIITISETGFSQDFTVPRDYRFEQKEDYAKHKTDVINCIQWLERTPVDQQREKRQGANAFLMAYITGSPDVTITLQESIVNLSEKNPDLLMSFIGGWTLNTLLHPELQNDEIKGNVAGLRSAFKAYKAGKGIAKDKQVEKLIELDEKGELENWVKAQLKK